MKGGLTPCPAEPEPYVLSRRLGCTLLYSSRPFYRDETPRRVGLPPPVAGKPSWGLGSAIWLPKLRGACREASIYASRPPVRHWWVGGMSGERQHGAIHVATGGQLGRRDRVGSFGFEGLEWWVDVAKTGWDALSSTHAYMHSTVLGFHAVLSVSNCAKTSSSDSSTSDAGIPMLPGRKVLAVCRDKAHCKRPPREPV